MINFIKNHLKETIIVVMGIVIIIMIFLQCTEPKLNLPVIIQTNFILPIKITESNKNCSNYINELNHYRIDQFITKLSGNIQTVTLYQRFFKQTLPFFYFDNLIIININLPLFLSDNNYYIGWDAGYYRRWINLFERPIYLGGGIGMMDNKLFLKAGIICQF